VRTEFGFHLIKVVKRIPGSAATQPSTTRVAGNAIVGEITDAVFAQAMDGCPIVVNK
jgi:parvulin-like peptidyl-prolyl isomerase